jgi:cytochrome P450
MTVLSGSAEVVFDRVLLTRDYLSDPYSFYSEIRNKTPLYFSQRMNGWVVTRYSDVTSGLLDKRLLSGHRVKSFSSRLDSSIQQHMCPLYDHFEKWIGNMDPPDHTRLRALVNKTFTPRMVQDLSDSIRIITNRLLDASQAHGGMDFVRDFAYPLPATVRREDADHDELQHLCVHGLSPAVIPGGD